MEFWVCLITNSSPMSLLILGDWCGAFWSPSLRLDCCFNLCKYTIWTRNILHLGFSTLYDPQWAYAFGAYAASAVQHSLLSTKRLTKARHRSYFSFFLNPISLSFSPLCPITIPHKESYSYLYGLDWFIKVNQCSCGSKVKKGDGHFWWR